jgi:subtilisin family serine protease
VWKQGITGNGTVVAILDDGVDYKSKDLMDNFVSMEKKCWRMILMTLRIL